MLSSVKTCSVCESCKRKEKGAGTKLGVGITAVALEDANTTTTEDADITTTGELGAGITAAAPEDAFIIATPVTCAGIITAAPGDTGFTVGDELGVGITVVVLADTCITVEYLIKDNTNDTIKKIYSIQMRIWVTHYFES